MEYRVSGRNRLRFTVIGSRLKKQKLEKAKKTVNCEPKTANCYNRHLFIALLATSCMFLSACGVLKFTYRLTKGTIVMAYKVTKFAGSTVYTVGAFTFDVVTAPLSWPLTHDDIETIDGLSPREAIAQGRVKASPYVVRGKRYVPMTVAQAETYREKGIASWYGNDACSGPPRPTVKPSIPMG